jgi:hypothetical protein
MVIGAFPETGLLNELRLCCHVTTGPEKGAAKHIGRKSREKARMALAKHAGSVATVRLLPRIVG